LVYPASVTGCDGRYSPMAQQFPLLEIADLPADSRIIDVFSCWCEFSWIVISTGQFLCF